MHQRYLGCWRSSGQILPNYAGTGILWAIELNNKLIEFGVSIALPSIGSLSSETSRFWQLLQADLQPVSKAAAADRKVCVWFTEIVINCHYKTTKKHPGQSTQRKIWRMLLFPHVTVHTLAVQIRVPTDDVSHLLFCFSFL